MKTRNALLKTGFFVCMLTAMTMFLVNCTKDESLMQIAKNNPTSEYVKIPTEIAMNLTAAEQAEFYTSKPDYTPATVGVEGREAGAWHPFFASGYVEGGKYPLLSNCDNPPIAEICPAIDMPGMEFCNDASQYVGYVALWAGNTDVDGFGPMKQFYTDYVCGMETGVQDGWHNGSFKKGNGSLHWRPYGTPFTSTVNEDGTVSIDSKISICNPLRPDKMCWSYSTGYYKNMDGDGTINWRWTGDPNNFVSPIFEPFAKSHLMSWGWLYY